MPTLNDKERLRVGEKISSTDKTERKEINQQVKSLMEQGVGPGDALAAAIKNVRRGKGLNFS